MRDPEPIPDYMLSTVELLRRAYPRGIADEELPTLMVLLGEAGMSNRNVAAAIGHYHNRSYVDFSYQANVCHLDESVTDFMRFAVQEQLDRAGFQDWLKEFS